jgi:predicted AlkP superfamily phosphohydrolase/phosphomutase
MSRSERRRVVAIGIDAAEPSLVRRLIERGDLPVLQSLAAGGVWGPVSSPAAMSSGALWPTFLTGRPPAEHGLYGEWLWKPDAMGLARVSWDHLQPFWQDDVSRGRTVTILDVPFAPRLDRPGCTEVLDWGAHDFLKGRLEASPPSVERLVAEVGGVHPFAAGAVDAAGPRDRTGLARVVAHCLAGVEQRGRLARRLLADTAPDLFLMVFTEVHRAGHLLWHTVDPSHPDHGAAGEWRGPGLSALLQAVDREIGHLRDLAGPEAVILVFSLHGMRPARGVPTVLGPLLEARGLAVPKAWRDHSWPERAGRVFTAVKGQLPGPAKRLYYRLVPRTVSAFLAQPAAPLPAYDWSRTVAISLPTDQQGWIRFNLRGREARGIVDLDGYEDLCRRVEQVVRAARRGDGRPIARAVIRTADTAEAAAVTPLPDLVVDWDDATFDSPLRLADPPVAAPAVGLKYSGQHAYEGFYLLRPPGGGLAHGGGSIAAEGIHGLVRDAAGRSA